MKKLSLSSVRAGILRRVKEFKKTKIKVAEFIKSIINKKRALSISRKVSAFSMILKVIAFSLIMTSLPAGRIDAEAENIEKNDNIQSGKMLDLSKYNPMMLPGLSKPEVKDGIQKDNTFQSGIVLNFSKSNPIIIPDMNKPNIIVGESEFAKRDREEKEAKVKELASRGVVYRDSTLNRTPDSVIVYDADLGTKRALAKKAASQFGIDWRILEAVWQVESGKAWITPVKSYAGAQGPMQFMSGTWNKYAIDGNGDGYADINNAEDAVYAGANLLAQAGGYEGNYQSALLSYNHAQWYVDKVKAIADSITE